MFRSRSYLFLPLLLAISLILVGAAFAQDASPTSIGVKEIISNGSIEGVFRGGATAYLYAFEGAEGDTVTISMTQQAESDLDPFLVLLGPGGEVIASDDDSGPEPFLSSLIEGAALPEDGTYLIMATSSVYINNLLVETGNRADDEEANETFTLKLEGVTASRSDEVLVAAVPVAIGETVPGESTVVTPVRYYALEGNAGDRISVLAASDDFDTLLYVFAPNGERIGVNDDDEDGGTTNSAVRRLELTEDGTYLIMATNLFFYSAGDEDAILTYSGGAFTLSVE